MSVFVFDDETIKTILYLIAIQRFSDYQVGPSGLMGQLCASTYEKILIQTAIRYPKFQKTTPHELSLSEIIRFLQKNNLVTPSVVNKLQDYLAYHDSYLNGAQTNPAKATEIIQFFCTEAHIKPEKELPNKTFHDVANRKNNAATADSKLEESDFDNLDALYPKCLFIQQEIQKRLTTPLKAAQPSAFAPNTGGIWLPFTTQDKQGYKEPIDGACVGVSFTPLGIRIGLNFGSHAHAARIRYYELLSNGELTAVLEALHRKGTGYCLCDTYWNYHIRNIQSLQWCLTLYGSTIVTIERAIGETKQQEATSLTGHRYLVSKVIERRPEDFTYIIQGITNEIPKVLDELYPILEAIQK